MAQIKSEPFTLILGKIPTWWSRPDSNRCPNIVTISFLHAYFFISCRQCTGKEQTNALLSWISLVNRHSLLLQHLLLFWVGGGTWKEANLCGGPNGYLITD